MNKERKTEIVQEIVAEIQGAEAIYAVDYRGLSVTQAAALRGRLRDAGTKFRVVKNSLSERAADEAGAEQLKPLLEGPTALALIRGDAALAAKALNDAARELGILEFKGGMMDGESLTADDVRSIARLPGREILHGQLVGTIAAPIGGLVRGLGALIAGLAIQLQQIGEKGLVGGETAPEGEAEPTTGGETAPEGEAEPAAGDEPEPEGEAEPAAGDESEPQAQQTEQAEQDAAPDAEDA